MKYLWKWVWIFIVGMWFNVLPFAIIFAKTEKNATNWAFIIPLIITGILIIAQIITTIILNKKEKEIQNAMLDDNITQLDDLNPYEFEEWVARLMRIQGYKAYSTQKSGDYGVDVIAEQAGWKIGIQVKKFNGPVGIKAVQEIASGMIYYGCQEGWVVSTAPYFTKAAINLAEKHNIKLLNKQDLAKYFKSIKKEFQSYNYQ